MKEDIGSGTGFPSAEAAEEATNRRSRLFDRIFGTPSQHDEEEQKKYDEAMTEWQPRYEAQRNIVKALIDCAEEIRNNDETCMVLREVCNRAIVEGNRLIDLIDAEPVCCEEHKKDREKNKRIVRSALSKLAAYRNYAMEQF